MKFEASQFRVIVEEGDPGVKCSSGYLAILETLDDGNWFPVAQFDSVWLLDLTQAVQAAHAYLGMKPVEAALRDVGRDVRVTDFG